MPASGTLGGVAQLAQQMLRMHPFRGSTPRIASVFYGPRSGRQSSKLYSSVDKQQVRFLRGSNFLDPPARAEVL